MTKKVDESFGSWRGRGQMGRRIKEFDIERRWLVKEKGGAGFGG